MDFKLYKCYQWPLDFTPFVYRRRFSAVSDPVSVARAAANTPPKRSHLKVVKGSVDIVLP